VYNYDDLIIPISNAQGEKIVVVAVPYLRSDVVQTASYSDGVNNILRQLTARARELYPDDKIVMMAHMYAKGADIAKEDASEKIIVGGQEEVGLGSWPDHPDYLTCGHIHKRQRIWGTNWARYTGSVLPMSFAEKDYTHGVDVVTINSAENVDVQHLIYTPQHPLRILPENDEEISPKKLVKLIISELPERVNGKLDDNAAYVLLKVAQDNVSNDEIKDLEDLFANKNAVLCRIQKINRALNIHTLTGEHEIQSVDEVLNRDPMETLREAFAIKHGVEMNEQQETLLADLLSNINTDEND
jgi:exonuclease SbcD